MNTSKQLTFRIVAIVLVLLSYKTAFAIDESIGIINDFKGTVRLVRNDKKLSIDKDFNLSRVYGESNHAQVRITETTAVESRS